ncbi:pentapeptide repeat-containing protein [Neisseria dentiae]|uniref:pentapeptide repeat-containing protein n=1 Tax=Neisseria dentiae TaxID=194197 RepID=UPI00359FC844
MSKKQPSDKNQNKFIAWIISLKNRFIAWLNKESRGRLIVLVALLEISILSLIFIYGLAFLHKQETWETIFKGNGIWTLIALMISAPIAFFIWKFRDENTIQQLEHQRKDVNLKEFQKIAEWVSGMHLAEDKVTEKNKSVLKGEPAEPNKETETAREYGQAGQNRHIHTPSRKDGTAGLQVAAVYMLRPFFCGEHGDSFREPALNLLTATWLALFKPIEQHFLTIEQQFLIIVVADADEEQIMIDKVVASPLAVALNQVLLSDGGKPLSRFPHIFPNLYLPGLQLNQPGVDQQVKMLWQGKDCRGIQLWGAQLQGAQLQGAQLQGAQLQGAQLQDAKLLETELRMAQLQGANLQRAQLQGAQLQGAKLQGAQLQEAQLQEAQLQVAQLQGANLQGANLQGANLQEANLQGANLQGANLRGTVVLDFDIDHSKKLQNIADLIVLVTEQPEKIYELTFQRKDAGINVTSIQPINLEATRKKTQHGK